MSLNSLLRLFLFTLPLAIALQSSIARAEDETDLEVAASPKKAWGEFNPERPPEAAQASWLRKSLLWIPNRVLDFVDIFRVDVGAGMSFGAVARVTKYGQVGFRSVAPLSVRVGDFGRRAPVLVEHSSEMGVGPAYLESSDRKVCTGEVGIGADLFLGAYLGICVEEVVDFASGLFFIDVRDDDLE